ncbi:MAG: DNA translocase FtsK [Patescibacteria group bacterium]
MPRKKRKEQEEEFPLLDAETRREIFGIFLFAAAGLLALSYFDLASMAGRFLDFGMQKLFGSLRLAFIAALVALGFLFAVRQSRARIVAGLVLLLLTVLGFVHLVQFPGQAGFAAVEQGIGGGYAGLYLAYPLYQLFGFWASLVILVALFFISLSLILPQPIGRLLSSSNVIFRALGKMLSLGSRWRSEIGESGNLTTRDSTGGQAAIAPVPVGKMEAEEKEGEKTEEGEEGDEADGSFSVQPAKRRLRMPKVDLSIDLLDKDGGKALAGDIRGRSAMIQKTLANFGIEVEMGEVAVGPTVTQYTLRPTDGVKLSSIVALQNDLALALAASSLRIEAPIPGKSLVGIEVPNEKTAMVRLRDVLESQEFARRTSNLTVALGKDVSGKPYVADLARMPHLLVAGSTGSGKSVCLNTIILSLLYENGPEDLKLLLIDPKRVELPAYNGIPHLISPAVTDVKKTIHALRWAIGEMDARFSKLESKGARDIKSYNEKVSPEDRMPYLVIVVDELADLMATSASEVEGSIVRLAQLARAVGIHLILATQRPSVDVITGLIKANITSRIAFAVAASVDSRTILDTVGAERLLGRGDMLFINSELGKPKRVQGAYVGEEEVHRIVNYIKARSDAPEYVEVTAPKGGMAFGGVFDGEDSDELLGDAKDIILQAGKASASLLQRRLKVGYARAARILDLLEAAGFIGPADGAKPREVLQSQGGALPQVVLQEEPRNDTIA